MRRLYKVLLLVLLVGIFLELGSIVHILSGEEHPRGNIAVVDVKGEISDSRETVASLKKYVKEEDVKAIVLRVDSPGGTVGASQEIHDQVLETLKKKPIIISMGDVAASGGYYIAAPATKIVANPGTITGSIGVISHFFVVENLLKKFHLKWEVIQGGKMKDLGSPLRNLTPEERKLLQVMTDDVHAQFIEAVAKGRKLPTEKVKALADGRVMSGRQAKAAGLVDDLGGLEHAIDVAAKLTGVAEPDVIYPKEKRLGWLRRWVEGKMDAPALKTEYRFLP
ncbi:MAG: signal peptide peptidase SppA [Pseudomonadota bacterium]